MTQLPPSPQIRHELSANRFELQMGDSTAVLQYSVQDGTIFFTHTQVPTELEGKGIGSLLVRAGLDFARNNAYRVVPVCWFVAGYIERHTEYQDLLKS